jgi:hypothetical protein
MQANQNPTYQEAKKISDKITKELFKKTQNIPKREITYEEAVDDVEIMVQINQLVQEMIERRNSRYLANIPPN